ncbi:MAG: hypothetical protein EU549_04975 [Promethearchaeota archaeon]|nr:MAG: hypothetical protein EU549_04975 [Candidatus Lokiarchaeota archaeon]
MDIRNLVKQYIDLKLLGIISSILILISEFLPWISNYSLIERYIIYTQIKIQESFLYLFPLVAGIICGFGSILVIYDVQYKIKSVVINFIGLGFLLIFFFDFIPNEMIFFTGTEIGLYICVTGAILMIFHLINILLLKEEEKDLKDGR